MLRFRPLPLLTVFTVLALALLIALGNWQMRRMAWKEDMIAQFDARGQAASLSEALCTMGAAAFSPSIRMPAPLLGEELRLYALREVPGHVRIGALRVPACNGEGERYLLIESGFEAVRGGQVTRPRSWRLEPLPEPGFFTPGNDPDTNEWYGFDRIEMAIALNVPADSVLDVWARADDGRPASLEQTPPAKHLGYALTWYGLALALVAVYLALHLASGRLRRG